MCKIGYTTQFKKDFKKLRKSGIDISSLNEVVYLLSRGKKLPDFYLDHKLHGKFNNRRELHLKPNLLLIYKIDDENLILERMGSHSQLFF